MHGTGWATNTFNSFRDFLLYGVFLHGVLFGLFFHLVLLAGMHPSHPSVGYLRCLIRFLLFLFSVDTLRWERSYACILVLYLYSSAFAFCSSSPSSSFCCILVFIVYYFLLITGPIRMYIHTYYF